MSKEIRERKLFELERAFGYLPYIYQRFELKRLEEQNFERLLAEQKEWEKEIVALGEKQEEISQKLRTVKPKKLRSLQKESREINEEIKIILGYIYDLTDEINKSKDIITKNIYDTEANDICKFFSNVCGYVFSNEFTLNDDEVKPEYLLEYLWILTDVEMDDGDYLAPDQIFYNPEYYSSLLKSFYPNLNKIEELCDEIESNPKEYVGSSFVEHYI